MRRFLLLMLPLLLLAACPRTEAPAPPGPPGSDTGPAAAVAGAPAQGMARIVFYRQAIPFLQALTPDLIVNGKRVGTAELGGAFVRDARPGGYELFSTHDPDSVVAFTLAAGETRYVKVGPELRGLGFRLSAREVPATQARPELEDLDLSREHLGG